MPPLKSLTSGSNRTRGNKGDLRYLDAALMQRHETACSLRAACRVLTVMAWGVVCMRLDTSLFNT